MTQEIVFTLVGGMGFFFLGMRMMSESLRKVAGNRLKNTLDVLTKRPIIGLLSGLERKRLENKKKAEKQ